MSIPTIIILSDSEDEYSHFDEHATEPYEPSEIYPDPADFEGETEEDEPSEEEEPYEEEEPSEEEEPYEEEEPSEEEEPFEEETNEDVPAPPPPPRVPSFRPYRDHPNGPLRMYTPRKRVIPIPQVVPPTMDQEQSPPQRRRVDGRRWNWMPSTLQEWRDEEGIPNVHEVGESSANPQVPSLTREPLHHTTPLLVARAARHDLRLGRLQQEVEGLAHQVGENFRLDTQTYWAAKGDHLAQQDEIDSLRRRLEECEERNAEMARRINAMEQGETPDHSHN